ncbi:MAG: hypothetical protein ACRDT6_24950 [Micromonosporaceae bacterium]
MAGLYRVVDAGSLVAVEKQAGGVSPVTSPPTLRWAVVLLAVETLVVVGLTAFLVYEDLAGAAQNQGLATFITWYAGGYAVGFAVATWGLWQRQRWSRTPALVLNLFGIPIGWFMLQEGLWWAGPPIIGYVLVVCWLLLVAPTREALGIH